MSLETSILDEIAHIRHYQHFIKLALEQIDKSRQLNCEDLEKIELLISTYLSLTKPHFQNLEECAQESMESRLDEQRSCFEYWNLPILQAVCDEKPKYYIGQTVLVSFNKPTGQILVPGRIYGISWYNPWCYNVLPLYDTKFDFDDFDFSEYFLEHRLEPID